MGDAQFVQLGIAQPVAHQENRARVEIFLHAGRESVGGNGQNEQVGAQPEPGGLGQVEESRSTTVWQGSASAACRTRSI